MSPRRLTLALLTSLLLFAAAPGQWAVTPLAWIALLPLLVACQGLPPHKAARLALVSGLAYYLSLIYWIIIALGQYGGLPLWVTIPALVALALYMAGYLVAFAALLAWGGSRLAVVWVAPLAWVSLDFIRGWLFTGFPWLDLGYGQYAWPLINQVADLGGHHVITFLIVMVNALLAELLGPRLGLAAPPAAGPKPPFLRLLLPLLLVVAACGYSTWRYQGLSARLAQAPTLAIGLVQGNVDQSEKWLPELQEQTVDTYLELSATAAAKQATDLLIWPETALPFFPDNHPLFQRVITAVTGADTPPLLTGAPHFETDLASGQTNLFNSAFLIAPTKGLTGVSLQRYDKAHLVPFGEYVPLHRLLPAAMPLVESMGNFTAGIDSSPLVMAKARLGILICFESIFPELARVRTNQGATLLVNLTNDAWYGRSSAPFQQVPMAVLRAIENRRSLARAANTGISCLIDPLGTVVAASPIFTKLELSGRLPLIEEPSFYTAYGFLFPYLCLILLSALLFYGNLRRNTV